MIAAVKRRLWIGLAALLAACSTVPTGAPLNGRSAVTDFAVDGRFALRVERDGEPAQSASGRLSWQHQQGGDRVLIANPLGGGVAEIELGRSARLVLNDGQVREAADADQLLFEATGYALPVSRLAGWLLARPAAAGQVEVDALGRPLRLVEAGWHIDYVYPDARPDALPSRLTLRRPGDIEVRLRLESWSELP